MGYQCGTCSKCFNSFHARQQHMNAVGHSNSAYECDTCDRCFGSRSALEQHMELANHGLYTRGRYSCRACNDGFYDEDDRDQHEIEDCNYCADCVRRFPNENSIRQHLNSRLHRGSCIECPFCKADYATAAGLCHHLETGCCTKAPSVNRDQVYRLVRSKDPTGIIAKNLIGWHGSPTYEADGRSWNGGGYECYLCHQAFSRLSGLNQHLGSPIHQQALYHCPNRHRCGKEFRSLAAVMNHLESESCGFTRFENVQRGINDMISGNRLIAFR
ncbi:hypothetical protein BJ170DRAFT_227397 [Xylariales sp. AK1849]|nr:hypothetical protein BJ170DRAFT_227397 [Xylariales sp. AK1849]